MNFTIKIYPLKSIPRNTTWASIKNDFSALLKKIGMVNENLDFQLIDSDKEHARMIIEGLSKLKVEAPSKIAKYVQEASSKEISDMEGKGEREPSVRIRYIYDRKIEFADLDKVIYYNIDYGVEGLYRIDENMLEEVQSKMLNVSDLLIYKKALNEHQYLIELETDLDTKIFDPILFLALVFCKLVDGLVFIEHAFENHPIRTGYYSIDELDSICHKWNTFVE